MEVDMPSSRQDADGFLLAHLVCILAEDARP